MSAYNQKSLLMSATLLVYIALIVFLPSVAFMPSSIIWFQDRQRLLELLLLVFVLAEAICYGLNHPSLGLINDKSRGVLTLVAALALASSLLAVSPRHATIEVSVFAGLFFLALLFARLLVKDPENTIKNISYGVWAAALLYMLSFYTGYITACIFKTPLHWPFPFTGFTNIRHFNQYQLWSLGLLSLPLLTSTLSEKMRRWGYLALTAWWVLLFYSASRGILVAWLVGMLATVLIYRQLAWPLLRSQCIQAIAGYCAYIFAFKIIPFWIGSTLVTGSIVRETTNDRLTLWYQALLMIKSAPWLGVGPMHFAWYVDKNAHPHNSILQLAAEWGLPATILILGLTAYALSHWLKRFNRQRLAHQTGLNVPLVTTLFFTLVSNAAYSLVDGVIVMPMSQVLMFTLIGLMIGYYALTHTPQNQQKTTNRVYLSSAVASLVLVIMVWSTLPEIIQGLTGSPKGFSIGYQAAGPRFWREMK